MSEVNVGDAAPVEENAPARRRSLMAVPEPGTLDARPQLDVQPREPTEPDQAAVAAYISQRHTSETAAEALGFARQTGLSPQWTAENLDFLKTDTGPLVEQLRQAPRLAVHLAQDPVRAAAAKDDAGPLAAIERWGRGYLGLQETGLRAAATLLGLSSATPPEWRRADEAVAEGFRQQHQVYLSTKFALGTASKQDLEELQRLEKRPGPDDGLAAPALAPFRMLPYMAGSIAARGAGGATAVAASAGVMGPVAAAAGQYAGGAVWDFYQDFGPLFRQLKGLRTEDGTDLLSDDEARVYAFAGSAVAAGITSGLGGRFVRMVPGVDGVLRRVSGQLMAQAALDPVKRAAIKALGAYGVHVLNGAALMAAQATASTATEEIAKGMHGQEASIAPVLHAGLDTFTHAIPDMLLLAGIEPGRRYLETRGRMAAAPQEAARLDAMVSAAKDSKLAERSPETFEQAVREVVAGSDAQTVFVDREAWDKHWTGKGQDPAEVATRVTGNGQAYAEAQGAGAEIAVPTEKYLTQLAKDGHAEALRENVKLSPDGFTLREAGKAKPDPEPALEALPEGQREQVRRSLGAAAATVVPLEPGSARALRELALGVIEGKRLGDIHPGRYDQAAQRHGDKLAEIAAEAAERATRGARNIAQGAGMATASESPGVGAAAFQRGSVQVSGAEANLIKTEGLERARDFSRALSKAAQETVDQADADRKFLQRYTKDDARAELGRAGGGHLEAVDLLLSGFELGQGTSRREVARRQALMAFIASEQAAGRDAVIPDSVLSKLDRFVHWKELTPGELTDLRSAVENIAHLAELKNTLLERKARVDREQGIGQLIGALRANVEAKPFRPTGSTVGNLERALEALQGLKYGARAMERVVNQLDGGDINGPWHRLVWDPVNDGTYRWHDLVRTVGKVITDQIDAMPKEELRRWRETRFVINGNSWDLTAAIAVALNSGNASNIAKLEKGWRDPSVLEHGLMPWSETTREEYLSQLTKSDWQFVQRVWDGFEKMWPEAAALEKKLTGLAPKQVKPQPFTRMVDGESVEMRGGYYPVIYDRDFSKAGARAEEASDLRSVQLFSPDYYRAATPNGHLQKRIEEYARPVLLSIDALPRKISEAAKDIAMREALLSVHSVLTDSRVRAALHTSELGRAGEKALLGWLRDTANDLVVPDNGAGTWFTQINRTRAGYTATLFAYNVGQTLQNLTAIVPATRAVGTKWMGDALQRLQTERGPLIDWIKEQSAVARNRERGGQPIQEALEQLAHSKGVSKEFMQFGLAMFQATDTAVVYPTWLAAYMKASAEKAAGGLGFDHETAVRHAEETVRLNVLANDTKDLPALLRNKVGRWMLPLFSYSAHRLNMLGDAVGMARGAMREGSIGKAATILGGMWGTFAIEQILSELVKGNGPQDENGDGEVGADDVGLWAAKVSVFAPLTIIPFFGQAARAAATGRDPLSTPEVSAVVTVVRAARDAAKLAYQASPFSDGPVDEDLLKREAIRLLEAGGYIGAATRGGGLPVSQIRSTLGYWLDDDSPKDTALQLGLGTAFGKKRKGKLLDLTE